MNTHTTSCLEKPYGPIIQKVSNPWNKVVLEDQFFQLNFSIKFKSPSKNTNELGSSALQQKKAFIYQRNQKQFLLPEMHFIEFLSNNINCSFI